MQHLAAQEGNVELLKIFVRYALNIQWISYSVIRIYDGLSPLDYARANGQQYAIAYLGAFEEKRPEDPEVSVCGGCASYG